MGCCTSFPADAPEFKIDGIYRGYVCDVYDGDTFTVIFDISKIFGGKTRYRKFRIRAWGYDSPELKPLKSLQNREDIIKRAIEAKRFLENLILRKTITIECSSDDKYGRLIGKVKLNNEYLSDIMIRNGHGYSYLGGTKKNM